MILCSECGTRYLPITDAYKCPCCGESNWPEDQEDEPPMRKESPHGSAEPNDPSSTGPGTAR